MIANRPGPKRDPFRVERACELRLQGMTWAEVAKAVGVSVSTLVRWHRSPEWAVASGRILERFPESLRYLAGQVLQKRLRHDLSDDKPDIQVAVRVLEILAQLRSDSNGSESEEDFAHLGGIVELPLQDRGLPSVPPQEVLRRLGLSAGSDLDLSRVGAPVPKVGAPVPEPEHSVTREKPLVRIRVRARRRADG